MRALVLMGLLVLSACIPLSSTDDTLYQRLGGQSGIEEIVDGLLWEIGGSPSLRPLFANTDIQRFRKKLIEQLCDITDGPCVYSGDSMRETHRHLGISRAQFNQLVEDLIHSMERADTGTPEQNALLARLVPYWPEIVSDQVE